VIWFGKKKDIPIENTGFFLHFNDRSDNELDKFALERTWTTVSLQGGGGRGCTTDAVAMSGASRTAGAG
jgi:hypothetical protein